MDTIRKSTLALTSSYGLSLLQEWQVSLYGFRWCFV